MDIACVITIHCVREQSDLYWYGIDSTYDSRVWQPLPPNYTYSMHKQNYSNNIM